MLLTGFLERITKKFIIIFKISEFFFLNFGSFFDLERFLHLRCKEEIHIFS